MMKEPIKKKSWITWEYICEDCSEKIHMEHKQEFMFMVEGHRLTGHKGKVMKQYRNDNYELEREEFKAI